jgi:hypothetical protein
MSTQILNGLRSAFEAASLDALNEALQKTYSEARGDNHGTTTRDKRVAQIAEELAMHTPEMSKALEAVSEALLLQLARRIDSKLTDSCLYDLAVPGYSVCMDGTTKKITLVKNEATD